MGRKVYTDIDYTSIDYDGLRNDMIECIKRRIPQYSDFSENDFGVVMAELFAHGLDVISYYTDRQVNEMFLATCKDRKSALKIASQMSYAPIPATPAKFMQAFEFTPSEDGYLIPKGFKVKTEATLIEPEIIYEVEEDFFMPPNVTGLEKDEDEHYKYLVPIVQGGTMNREILGTSDRTANQEFQLGYEPVILDSLFLEVFNNGDYEIWDRVDSFLHSDRTDRHFTAMVDEYNTVTVRFGDGIHGQIPYAYENGIVATYRVGGGSFGNVGANTIVSAETQMIGLENTFNPYEAYEVGRDQETLEELKRNIPASVHTLNRAVTLKDFENIIRLTNEVISSKAIRTEPLEATIFVLPKNPSYTSNTVDLDDMLKDRLEKAFEGRTMLGTSFVIAPAMIKEVDLTIRFRPTSPIYTDDVKQSIADIVHSMLDLGSMGVGEELILSDIVSELTNIDTGVRNLRSLVISSPLSDIVIGESGDGTMLESEVIVLRNLTLEVF